MSKPLFVIAGSLIVACMLSPGSAEARWPWIRARHADRNRDGVVTAREIRMDRHWAHNHRAVITHTSWKPFDVNHDGYIEVVEYHAFLKDYLRIVETDGRAIVNTDLERAFDVNNDGVIDRAEAEAIRKEIK